MTTKLPFVFDFNFPMEGEREAIKALYDLLTDAEFADMTVRQLVDAIMHANALLWNLQYFIDDGGSLQSRLHK
jgi:hypothetical protein